MALVPITIEIAADKDATTWTDLTSKIRRESIRMGGQAETGVAGSGFGFDFEDPAAAFSLPARRVVRLSVGEPHNMVVAAGRVTEKGLSRISPPVGDARGFDVSLNDPNAHLQGIPVHRWVRPAETDVARMTALLDDFLSGSPRPSTALFDYYLSASDPVNLEAYTYDATNPAGVVSHVCEISGKLFFVTHDDAVFYDAYDSTAYGCALVVTDAIDADPLAYEYNPIWTGTPGIQDGSEFYSGLHLSHGDDLEVEYINDSGAETAHDFWEEVVFSDAASEAQAVAEAEALVAERALEEERFSFSVLFPKEEPFGPALLFYGATFSFRAAAAGVLTPRVLRASRVTWSTPTPGIWRADVEAGFPKKVAPRLTRGGGLAPVNPAVPPAEGEAGYYDICNDLGIYTLSGWDDGGAVGGIPAYGVGSTVTVGPGDASPPGDACFLGPAAWCGGAFSNLSPTLPQGARHGQLSGRVSIPAMPNINAGGLLYVEMPSGGPANWIMGEYGRVGLGDMDAGASYFFKMDIWPGDGHWREKKWKVGDAEPGWSAWHPLLAGEADPIEVLVLRLDYVDADDVEPPSSFLWDQLTWCYDAVRATGYVGASYGPAYIAAADGSTSAFTLPSYPGSAYIPGSLSVYVDGVWQPVTETDPAAGEFDLGWDPAEDDVITAAWRVPS